MSAGRPKRWVGMTANKRLIGLFQLFGLLGFVEFIEFVGLSEALIADGSELSS